MIIAVLCVATLVHELAEGARASRQRQHFTGGLLFQRTLRQAAHERDGGVIFRRRADGLLIVCVRHERVNAKNQCPEFIDQLLFAVRIFGV